MPLRPPRLARLLLAWRPLGTRRADVEADLLELFHRRVGSRGRTYARYRYFIDVLSLWRHRTRDTLRPVHPRTIGVGDMRQDIVFALRLFRRQPASFGLAIAGLAIAIGITTAMFTVVHAVALRGSGASDAASLVRLYLQTGPPPTTSTATMGNWSYEFFRQLRLADTRLAFAASARTSGDIRNAEGLLSAAAAPSAVSGDYFGVLGGRAVLGRPLTATDDTPGAPGVVVVSYGFWKSRLNADRAVIGRTLWFRDAALTIVGVAERGFVGATSQGAVPVAPEFWWTFATSRDAALAEQHAAAIDREARIERLRARMDLDLTERETLAQLIADAAAPARGWNPPVDVMARLPAGFSGARAAAEVAAIATRLFVDAGMSSNPSVRVAARPIDANAFAGIVTILLITVGLVVLLACANVTNLLLATATSRAHEIATRLAIGASRARVVRQLLTESLLLGCVSGVLGLVMAIWIAPPMAGALRVPATADVTPDISTYLFVTAVTLIAGVAAGLAPAWRSGRIEVASGVGLRSRGAASASPARLRAMLIGGQAGISMILLTVAALFGRSVVHAATFDIGFDPSRLFAVAVELGQIGRGWDAARMQDFRAATLDRIRQIPGVTGAALVSQVPFGGSSNPPLPNGRAVVRNETTAGYFDALGIRVLRGRTYNEAEVAVGAPVAVISERLAQTFWHGRDPIGSSLNDVWGPDDQPNGPPKGILRRPAGTRVIGIVADTTNSIKQIDAPTIYLPLGSSIAAQVVVATDRDPRTVARAVQDALAPINPDVRRTTWFLEDRLARELDEPRGIAMLAMAVGLTALLLAAIGLFGTTTFAVVQRTREVGIRMALGATDAGVVRMVIRQSLTPVLVGLACGLFASWFVGTLIRRALYGISSHDPAALATAIVILVAAGGLAAWFPARRAARINPAETLRAD
jgi:predicted permease